MVIQSALLSATLLTGAAFAHAGHPHGKSTAAAALTCPVTHDRIHAAANTPKVVVNNQPVLLCCADCVGKMKASPAKYLRSSKDPVTGKPFRVTAKSPRLERNGDVFLFSSAKTAAEFRKEPAKFSQPAAK